MKNPRKTLWALQKLNNNLYKINDCLSMLNIQKYKNLHYIFSEIFFNPSNYKDILILNDIML